MKCVRGGAAAVVLAGLFAFPATASAATACTATVLPTPPGRAAYNVTGTDGHGTFVGVVLGPERWEGVVWRDGGVTLLEDFVPLDVNESGLMGGYTIGPANGRFIAALRPLDGPMRTLTASYSTHVSAVNEAGDAVGRVFLEHPVVAFSALWRAPEYEEEGFQVTAAGSEPLEIDDTGLAIGSTDFPDRVDTVWSTATADVLREYGPEVQLYDLDKGVIAATRDRRIVTIDGRTGAEAVVPGTANALPFALNDGVIVGSVRRTAMLWRGGEAVVLPAPPNTTTREASAVNATGTQAAGISITTDGVPVATLWNCSAG